MNSRALPSYNQQLSPQINGVQMEPYVIIEEQPASNGVRFRYESEGRFAPIPGVNSTAEHPTYPKLKVMNYKGSFTVKVSCVTDDKPHK